MIWQIAFLEQKYSRDMDSPALMQLYITFIKFVYLRFRHINEYIFIFIS